MFVTKRHISRRDVLRGVGATIALPFLEAMVPARTLLAKTAAAARTRLSCIEMVHGAAGSTAFGLAKNMWSPAEVGRTFDLSPSSLSPLEPYRDYLTIISNTDVRNAEAFGPQGDWRRPLPIERGLPDPGAPAPDRRVRRLRRRLARSALRAAIRPGHAGPVDAAVHRERRSVRRLCLRLCVRVHRYDQLGGADRAAADGARSALCVRSALRRGRHSRTALGSSQDAPQHPRLGCGRSRAPAPRSRPVRQEPARRIPERHPRNRTADTEDRGAQRQRRAAGAAGRAGRRAGLVRRAREADVRFAGARVCRRHHARLLVQARTRWIRARLSGERREAALPSGLPSRRARELDHAVRADQQASREPRAVLPRKTEEHERGRQEPAGEHARDLRLADGQFQRAQPQALPAVPRGTRRRPPEGQHAREGAGWHADGQRDAHAASRPRPRRPDVVRRQHGEFALTL